MVSLGRHRDLPGLVRLWSQGHHDLGHQDHSHDPLLGVRLGDVLDHHSDVVHLIGHTRVYNPVSSYGCGRGWNCPGVD